MPLDKAALGGVLARSDGLICAWLFGSQASGRALERSDIDIAALFVSKPTLEERLDLQGRLQDAARRDDVDLVILNGASPVLAFEAICGQLLVNKDPHVMAAYVSLASREYESTNIDLRRQLLAQTELARPNRQPVEPTAESRSS